MRVVEKINDLPVLLDKAAGLYMMMCFVFPSALGIGKPVCY